MLSRGLRWDHIERKLWAGAGHALVAGFSRRPSGRSFGLIVAAQARAAIFRGRLLVDVSAVRYRHVALDFQVAVVVRHGQAERPPACCAAARTCFGPARFDLL
jgi:hypothetical protein